MPFRIACACVLIQLAIYLCDCMQYAVYRIRWTESMRRHEHVSQVRVRSFYMMVAMIPILVRQKMFLSYFCFFFYFIFIHLMMAVRRHVYFIMFSSCTYTYMPPRARRRGCFVSFIYIWFFSFFGRIDESSVFVRNACC